MSGMDILLWAIAALLVLIGLAGVVLPALPGIPLMFGGFLMMAWLDDFTHIGTITLTVLGAPDILVVSEVESLKVLQDLADRIAADDASVVPAISSSARTSAEWSCSCQPCAAQACISWAAPAVCGSAIVLFAIMK